MYPATTPTMLAWLSTSVSTAMTYPLVFNPFRDSCVGLIRHWSGCTFKKRSLEVLVAFVFVPASAIVGGRVDDLGVANALTGAVTGCLVAYILPIMIYHVVIEERLRSLGPQHYERLRLLSALARGISVAGIFFGIAGTAKC